MNYQKLLNALLKRGFTPERAKELASWYCYSPRGTPYPQPTTEAFCKGYVEEEHPRDERGRWTLKDGSGNPYSDDPDWSNIGRKGRKDVTSPELEKLRKKMRLQDDEDDAAEKAGKKYPKDAADKEARIRDRRKRQEAELVREEKHRQREEREKELELQRKMRKMRSDELVEIFDDDLDGGASESEREQARRELEARGIDEEDFDYYRWTDTGCEAREARIKELEGEFDHIQAERDRFAEKAVKAKTDKEREMYERYAKQAEADLDEIEKESKELKRIANGK